MKLIVERMQSRLLSAICTWQRTVIKKVIITTYPFYWSCWLASPVFGDFLLDGASGAQLTCKQNLFWFLLILGLLVRAESQWGPRVSLWSPTSGYICSSFEKSPVQLLLKNSLSGFSSDLGKARWVLQSLPHLNLHLPTSVAEMDLACDVRCHVQRTLVVFHGCRLLAMVTALTVGRALCEAQEATGKEGGREIPMERNPCSHSVAAVPSCRPDSPLRVSIAALPCSVLCLWIACFKLDQACKMKGKKGKNFTLRTYGDDQTHPTWAPRAE